MSLNSWTIYSLADPRSPEEVRYVGKTSCTLKVRLSGHLCYARRSSSKVYLVCWLKSLMREGLQPVISVLEKGSGDWETAERQWIARCRQLGYRLCNSTDGGEGASPGHVKSLETRAKLSIANTGKRHAPEARARMSAARKGRGPVLTSESYIKMSRTKTGRPGPKQSAERVARRVALVKTTWALKIAAGWKPKPCTEEGRARTTAANTGRKCSPETRAKIAAANAGRGLGRKLSPETCAKMSRTRRKKALEAQLLRIGLA